MGRKAAPPELSEQLDNLVDIFVKRRAELNLTVEEIGLRSGMGEGWIRRWERKLEKNPTMTTLMKLSKALDLDLTLMVMPT